MRSDSEVGSRDSERCWKRLRLEDVGLGGHTNAARPAPLSSRNIYTVDFYRSHTLSLLGLHASS